MTKYWRKYCTSTTY